MAHAMRGDAKAAQQKSLPFREAFLLPLLLYSRCFVLAFADAFAAAAF